MGKQSTRKNKTIYQICREAQGLTREKAAELMDGISDSKIEKNPEFSDRLGVKNKSEFRSEKEPANKN